MVSQLNPRLEVATQPLQFLHSFKTAPLSRTFLRSPNSLMLNVDCTFQPRCPKCPCFISLFSSSPSLLPPTFPPLLPFILFFPRQEQLKDIHNFHIQLQNLGLFSFSFTPQRQIALAFRASSISQNKGC